ncbi:MAG: FAD-dependent oxidoreductase [bacterium]
MRIGIIGAGHAGVEAAATAAASGAQVTLFSAEPVLPYFRPRLIALAFGQVAGEAVRLHPAQWYLDKGITLRLDSRVTAFDADRCSLTIGTEEHSFEGIVLTTGAEPILPCFASGAPDHVMPLWTAENADRIRSLIKPGGTIGIVGGGAIGVEAALRATSAGIKAVIIERAGGLIAGRLMPAAADVLMKQLVEKGIRILLKTAVMQTAALPGGRALITLDSGEAVEADLVILCVGSKNDLGMAQRAGLKTSAGVIVDSRLQTSAPHVFACGDIAEVGGIMCSTAAEAVIQGRIAGANLCAVLSGGSGDMLNHKHKSESVSIKLGDLEMHLAGRPQGSGLEVKVLEGSNERACRLLVMKDGRTVGVQMVGTNLDFRKFADTLVTQ